MGTSAKLAERAKKEKGMYIHEAISLAVHESIANEQARNAELLSVLRDCESYAHAMGRLNNSEEGAQLAARCHELIAKTEGEQS